MQKINRVYAKLLAQLANKIGELATLHNCVDKNTELTIKDQMQYEKLKTDVKQRIAYLAKYAKMW